MNWLQILGLGLVGVGVVLLVLGVQATGTFGEEVRHELTGEYSSGTLWYIIGGIIVGLLGVGLAIFGGRVIGGRSHHTARPAH